MTVTNPDGSVDAVHEFDNKLSKGNFFGSGADLLTALVAGETSITGHQIRLGTSSETNNVHCAEPTLYQTAETSVILTATVTRDVTSYTPVRFKASCVFIFDDPQESLEITTVITSLIIGSPIASYNTWGNVPATMAGNTAKSFTLKSIEPITVKHNQGVFINVVISFS